MKAKAAALVVGEENWSDEYIEGDEGPPPTLLNPTRSTDSLASDLGFIVRQLCHTDPDVMSPEGALHLLYSLRESLGMLRDLDAALARHIYLAGEHGDVRVEGLPPARVQRGRDRKAWDGRGMAMAVVDAKLKETGEVPTPHEVASWVLDAVGIGYGRVTVLRALGLKPGDYCESSPGAISVQFVQ